MKKALFFVLVTLFMASSAHASVLFTIGSGSAVTIADRSATFDSLGVGNALSAYSEDQLFVTVNDTNFAGFDAFARGSTMGFHYGTGGNSSYVSIRPTDSVDMYAVEFLLGHGWAGDSTSPAHLIWETYKDASLTDSGSYTTTIGTVVGWNDVSGFDELRVGAHHSAGSTYTALGQYQAIALDNVNVQTGASAVPEPATMILFGAGLVGFGVRRRKA